MAKKITTIQELNNTLIEFLDDIMSVGSSTSGNKFDKTVREKLRNHLDGAKYIPAEQWCSREKDSIFLEHYKTTLDNKFDFTHLPTLIDNGRQLDLMIIDKPNGSQKWPDLLVVFKGIGLPIEIKSTKNDVIIWNGGLPKPDTLYIYNCYGKSKTTCFLGQHVISDDELDFLKQRAEFTKQFNEWHKNGKWNYYVRNMFNSNQSFFENNNDKKKANELERDVFVNENKLKELGADGHKRTIVKLKREIDEWSNETIRLLEKYQKEQENRLFIEQQTKDMILGLTWDFKQKTDFSFGLDEILDDDLEIPQAKNDLSSPKPKM